MLSNEYNKQMCFVCYRVADMPTPKVSSDHVAPAAYNLARGVRGKSSSALFGAVAGIAG